MRVPAECRTLLSSLLVWRLLLVLHDPSRWGHCLLLEHGAWWRKLCVVMLTWPNRTGRTWTVRETFSVAIRVVSDRV